MSEGIYLHIPLLSSKERNKVLLRCFKDGKGRGRVRVEGRRYRYHEHICGEIPQPK